MLGINIGSLNTIYSLCSRDENSNFQTKILLSDVSSRTIPSIISFTENQRLIGEQAKNQIKKDDIVNNQPNEENNINDININDIEVKKKEKELNTKMNNEGNINTGFGLNNINNEDNENNNEKFFVI